MVGKVIESLIKDRLMKHMTGGRHFCDAQHGFVPGRCCMTQLLATLELGTRWFEKGEPLDVARVPFTDVPHTRLFQKQKACGIDGNLL